MKTVYISWQVLAKGHIGYSDLNKNAEVVNGGIEAINEITQLKGVETWIITSSQNNEEDLRLWLATNYPSLSDRLLFVSETSKLDCDILLTLDSNTFETSGKVLLFDYRNPKYEWNKHLRNFRNLSSNSMKLRVLCCGYSVFLINNSNTAIKKITLATSRNEFCEEGAAIIESDAMVFENIDPKGEVEIYDNNMFRHIFLDILRVDWADGEVQENLTISSYDKA